MRRFTTYAVTAAVLVAVAFWAYVEFSPDSVADSFRRALKAGYKENQRSSGVRAEAPVAAAAASAGRPAQRQDLAKLPDELLAKLPSMEPEARDLAIREMVRQWRVAGPPGTQGLIDFLRSGRDFLLREGYTLENNRLQLAPTLRLALIDAALDFDGTTAVMLEVLRSPKSSGEMEFVVRNLEQRFPGVYRQEALAALGKSLAGTESDVFDPRQGYFLGAVQHFRAAELLPAAERMVANGGASLAAPYAQALAAFPVEVRRPALARLFAEPKVVEYLVEEARGVNDLDYSDPELSAQVVQLFTNRLNAAQRSNFLQAFNGSPRLARSANFFQPTTAGATADSAKIADALPDLRGRKAVLEQLSAHAETPELQGELSEAKRSVTAEIAWRETAARGDGRLIESMEVPIGNGIGNAVIQGKRIERLELAPQ